MPNEARKTKNRESCERFLAQSNKVLKKDHWLALVRFVTRLIDKLELDQPTNQSADNRSSLCDVSGGGGGGDKRGGRAY